MTFYRLFLVRVVKLQTIAAQRLADSYHDSEKFVFIKQLQAVYACRKKIKKNWEEFFSDQTKTFNHKLQYIYFSTGWDHLHEIIYFCFGYKMFIRKVKKQLPKNKKENAPMAIYTPIAQ